MPRMRAQSGARTSEKTQVPIIQKTPSMKDQHVRKGGCYTQNSMTAAQRILSRQGLYALGANTPQLHAQAAVLAADVQAQPAWKAEHKLEPLELKAVRAADKQGQLLAQKAAQCAQPL